MLNHTDMTTEVFTAMNVAILRAVGERADHADIFQDAVVACLEGAASFDAARGKAATFCAKVAGNVARNHCKSEGYRSHDVVTKGEEGEPVAIIDGLPGADGRADALRTEEGQWLAMALATLTDDERAFIRALNQGMAKGEAGALVGWSPVQTTRKHKAIAEKLKALR